MMGWGEWLGDLRDVGLLVVGALLTWFGGWLQGRRDDRRDRERSEREFARVEAEHFRHLCGQFVAACTAVASISSEAHLGFMGMLTSEGST
jgi:hypothetical protein